MLTFLRQKYEKLTVVGVEPGLSHQWLLVMQLSHSVEGWWLCDSCSSVVAQTSLIPRLLLPLFGMGRSLVMKLGSNQVS